MDEAPLSDEDRELARRLLEQLWGVDITKVTQVRLEDGSVMTVPQAAAASDAWAKIRQEAETVIALSNDDQYTGGQQLAAMILKALDGR